MKHSFILLILICISETCTAQVLRGQYCNESDLMIHVCYTFHSDSTFEYYHQMSVAIEEGQGHYELKDDNLTLQYDSIEFYTKRIKIEKIEEFDSIGIFFHVVDFESSEVLTNYKIRLLNFNDVHYDKFLGRRKFVKYPHSNTNNFVAFIEHEGYVDQAVTITNSGKYNVYIELRKGVLPLNMKSGVELIQIGNRNKSSMYFTGDCFPDVYVLTK